MHDSFLIAMDSKLLNSGGSGGRFATQCRGSRNTEQNPISFLNQSLEFDWIPDGAGAQVLEPDPERIWFPSQS